MITVSDTPQIGSRQVKIIVVDDEEIVLSLVRDALEDSGYAIALAGGALDALEKIEKEYFDFILTDIRMPEIDGIELVKRAREINPALGVIFMTGYANLDSAKDAIKEGAYDYIMKPFELNEMRQAVRNAVKKKQKDVEKTITTELTRLSDLNQLMYTVGDRISLVRLSLGFTMMQTKAPYGCIVFKNTGNNDFGTVATDNLRENRFDQAWQQLNVDYFDVDTAEHYTPQVIDRPGEHPLCREFDSDEMVGLMTPPWYTQNQQLVYIPLTLGRKLYGFLILGFAAEAETPRSSDLKFLSITASQIGISLENITLLDETRNAYGRLQDLQEQTIQLEKMATKGQMSAEIGHELNNFLGVVSGNLSLMQHHLENKNYGELDRHLRSATDNLEKISSFSRGLMDFSGLSSSFESCDVNSLIEDVIEYIKPQKRFDEIEIVFDRSAADIVTRADSCQLQQLLYNLIYNGADAFQGKENPETNSIIIRTARASDGEGFAISVRDNGTGFKQEMVARAFKERFTTKKTGHGFGLLVCKRILENHKAGLKIDSIPGEGTTVTMSFPIVAARAAAADPA